MRRRIDLRALALALMTLALLHFGPTTLSALSAPAAAAPAQGVTTVPGSCPNVRCSDIDSCEFRVNRHCCVDTGGTSCTTADCGAFETCP